jgi:hypothetical protein
MLPYILMTPYQMTDGEQQTTSTARIHDTWLSNTRSDRPTLGYMKNTLPSQNQPMTKAILLKKLYCSSMRGVWTWIFYLDFNGNRKANFLLRKWDCYWPFFGLFHKLVMLF